MADKSFERKSNRTEVAELVLGMKCKKMAEIGVRKSRLVKHIMQSEAGKVLEEYWAIDHWPIGVQDQYQYALNLSTYFPKIHVVRLSSLEASTIFPDGYFDLVFLDADHSYESVRKDIDAWTKKIRSGGILCGHDFSEESSRFPGVALAVKEAFREDFRVSTDTLVWRWRVP